MVGTTIMNFGDHLARSLLPEWQTHYIDYAKLKALLKSTRGPNEEHFFIDKFEEEVRKVVQFRSSKISELNDACGAVERKIKSLSDPVEFVETELMSLTENVLKLSAFVKLNYTAALKILEEHDKYATTKIKSVFTNHLKTRRFHQDHLDETIIRLSAAYDNLRRNPTGFPVDTRDGTNDVGGDFIRSTTKYWVHPDNVTAIKCIILQHLPVLVHTDSFSPAITSVYLDNSSFSLYHQRMNREEGAQAIRIRYYGQNPSPSDTVFVERKTHHAKWTGLRSVKARFGTKEEYVQAILEGQFDVDSAFRKRLTNGDGVAVRETETAKKLALEIQDTIRQMKLAPMISTSYNRMAFQVPGDPRFRISLDTELRFWREDVSSVPGCGIDEIEDGDIFPYAVLEVKTQTHEGVEQPEWVTELVESSLVRAAPKFSKFGHGVATLRPGNVSILPAWLEEMDNDNQKPTSLYDGPCDLLRKAMIRPLENSSVSQKVDFVTVEVHGHDIESQKGSIITPSSDSTIVEVDPLPKKTGAFRWDSMEALLCRNGKDGAEGKACFGESKVKRPQPSGIDPKLYMQNERTLLQWVKLGLITAAVGAGIVNFLGVTDPAVRNIGILVTVSSILFIVLGYMLYIWRGYKTKKRDRGHYDSIPAVTFVCIILVAALALNVHLLVFSRSVIPETPGSGPSAAL